MRRGHLKLMEKNDTHAIPGPDDTGLMSECYSYGYQAARDVRNVLKAAHDIEPEMSAVSTWYRLTGIAALGGLTAEQLVHAGRALEVLRFLRSIKAGGGLSS
ncbi:hypothetical protein [Dyella mobilis]|uniref:Uncharacterized protein n=1 Tax=Dyella mobilis TaxID=1849582 RepID=A0ABS2KDK4_9GAMM|nr:hypothetical protein [Dyella mobilis]MBM7128968.1 hypothetical protein [Dyella mobilis]GLQ99340.1 hypothetical protein GCM10007863_37600 [Dyella mobilis]